MQHPVIIIGAKQLGAVALDIFQSNDVMVYCLLDDDKSLHRTEVNDVTVMGDTDDEHLLSFVGKKCEAFIAVEEAAQRKSLMKLINDQQQTMPVNAVHKDSSVSEQAVMGHGNLVSAGVIINTNAKIGDLNLLNARALVDHHATIGTNVQVGAGAIIGAGASVEDNVFIGAGAVIVPGIKIEKGARIGAGSVVIADVKARETVFGNPAQKVSK
jgi:sugar O-acyltransferase (sialic acid O-acetyltransferase NeuD family)